MRVYLEFIKNAFQSNLAYRMDSFLRLVGEVFGLFIQVTIWRALLLGGRIETQMGVITLAEMVTYVVISRGIRVFTGNEVFKLIQDKVQSGEIAMDLIKPMSFNGYLFADTLGNNLFSIFFNLIPLIVVGISIFGLLIPPVHVMLWFLLILVNGLILHFLLMYIFGLLAFWFLEIWTFRRWLDELVDFFSGAIIPLWFFPKVFFKISQYLPFKLIFFTPIAIFLQKINSSQILSILVQQFIWIGVLLLIQKWIWSRGIRKLVIQGG